MGILQIRLERLERDWTMQEVAGRVGITKQSMHLIENGVNKPSYPVLVKLESLFGKSHRELLKPAEAEAVPAKRGCKHCGKHKKAGSADTNQSKSQYNNTMENQASQFKVY